MGEIVLAAKITHVPTLIMSEQPGRLFGKRQQAIDGHKDIARRAKALGADTIVILDTHWCVNGGYHINANHHFEGVFTSSEFNRQVDLHVLKLWQESEMPTFIKMLPDYAKKCSGEGEMHDTVMLLGALGWDNYNAKCEVIGEYFPSSGTGQVNVVFPVQ